MSTSTVPQTNGAPALGAPATAPLELSPSQIDCYLECPFRWYARYRLREPEAPTAALGIGHAVHATIAHVMRIKQDDETNGHACDLRPEHIADFAAVSWAAEAPLLPTAERTAEAKAQTIALTAVWWQVAAPQCHPIAIEQHTHGLIGGVPVHGIVDLVSLEEYGPTLVDIKTASKKPGSISAAHQVQLTTYGVLRGDRIARLDTLVRTKSPSIVQHTQVITEADRRHVAALYPIVADAIATEIYPPRRSSNLCSRRYCASWRTCEAEFGGTVRD